MNIADLTDTVEEIYTAEFERDLATWMARHARTTQADAQAFRLQADQLDRALQALIEQAGREDRSRAEINETLASARDDARHARREVVFAR